MIHTLDFCITQKFVIQLSDTCSQSYVRTGLNFLAKSYYFLIGQILQNE